MLFNSIEFLIFLVSLYLIYWILRFRGQNSLLLVASYFFYGWWNVSFLYLIVLSTAIDFCCGAMIDTGRISRLNRRLASLSTILAAFLFNTLKWNAVEWHLKPFRLTVQWGDLLPSRLTEWDILLGTLAIVTIANLLYHQATKLPEKQRRRVFLIASISMNLLILGVFKYFNFFAVSAGKLLTEVGIHTDFVLLNLVLPVGISFYTFKAISYAVDVYQGKLKSCNHFWDFALFWAYFPPLFAGPIDRAAHLLPQLTAPRKSNTEQFSQGIFLILFGLFKKVAIADGVSGSVNAVYNSTGVVSWSDVVMATILYAIQIYCDFSGYSDTARGVSKLFGIELVFNFNLPYFSKNPSEFWRRWHISLSSWLRDYLYIPLGGNRKGEFNTYLNLMTTMLLGGLWHGAAWNFVLWGFYHGSLLCGYRAFTSKSSAPASTKYTYSQQAVKLLDKLRIKLFAPFVKLPIPLVELATIMCFFVLTCYGWLLFRATSLSQILKFTGILFTDFGNFTLTMPKLPLSALVGILVLVGYELLEHLRQKPALSSLAIPVRSAFYATLILILLMGESNAPAQFIYSQF